MANPDRTEMQRRLKFRLRNRTDLAAELNRWLNDGLLELATKVKIRQLDGLDATKTFTNGSSTVTFPTNMVAVLDIRNTTQDRPLNYIEWPKYRQIKVLSGEPRQWTVYSTTIYLDRLANSTDALSISGQLIPNWGSLGTDTPGIDDQLIYGVELLATCRAWRDLGQSNLAAKIDNPDQPGVGEFWSWIRSNRIPQLHQGMAFRQRPSFMIAPSYDGLT